MLRSTLQSVHDAKYKMRVEDIFCCNYCGSAPEVLDHVPPISIFNKPILPEVYEEMKCLLVPACAECNAVLHDLKAAELAERATFLLKHYQRKYKKLLAMPRWSEAELSEVSQGLQQSLRDAMTLTDLLKARLEVLAHNSRGKF